MVTYPNQKIVRILKRTPNENFLQVNNGEWQEAARTLSGAGLKLYLYLASNKDGFELALSQKAFEEATGTSRNAYHRAVDELMTRGYIASISGNNYVFATTPNIESHPQEVSTQNGHMPKIGIYPKEVDNVPTMGRVSTQNGDSIVPKMGREIDNAYKTNNTNSVDSDFCPKSKEGIRSDIAADESYPSGHKDIETAIMDSETRSNPPQSAADATCPKGKPDMADGSAHSEPDSTDGSAHYEPHPEGIGANDGEVRFKSCVGSAHVEPIISREDKEETPPPVPNSEPPKRHTYISGDGLPGRRIRDLSSDEVNGIKQKLKKGVPYLDIEREYGMRSGTITSKFEEHWKMFICAKANGRV